MFLQSKRVEAFNFHMHFILDRWHYNLCAWFGYRKYKNPRIVIFFLSPATDFTNKSHIQWEKFRQVKLRFLYKHVLTGKLKENKKTKAMHIDILVRETK